MLVGAHFAGAAIENAMLGAAHACANPLTAHYGITHGIAVGLMLPTVIQFNAQTENALYGGLGQDAEELIERIISFKEDAKLPTQLRDLNVKQDSLSTLAKDATEQWTGKFNPRPVSESDFLALYESVY